MLEPDDELPDAPLPTWDAVQAYARDRFDLDADEERWLSTTVFWDDSTRSQQVRVTTFERADGQPWLVLRSRVCRGNQLALKKALRLNDVLGIGTLALTEDDAYDLVYSFPLAVLTAAGLDDLIDQVAAAADDLEERTTGVDEY